MKLLCSKVIVPVNVYSASYDNACGIQLEPGHEYLLAGQFVNGTMVTRLCGQILRETPKAGQPKDDILEWGEVPVQLQNKLGSQALDQLCPGLLAQQQPQSETTQKTAAQ
jgi:hypothetical protein